jgi:hypothetical protein
MSEKLDCVANGCKGAAFGHGVLGSARNDIPNATPLQEGIDASKATRRMCQAIAPLLHRELCLATTKLL